MLSASYQDKKLIVDILTKSFDDNQSVNYIVKQDQKRVDRIRALMDYSFELCQKFGQVYLSDDQTACALILYPELKKTNFWAIRKDIQLILRAIGVDGIPKALKREGLIKKAQWKGDQIYLWFIGVDPESQGKGKGTAMLQAIIEEADKAGKQICLETSTLKNIPWYKRNGFEIYNEIDLSYMLYFLKR